MRGFRAAAAFLLTLAGGLALVAVCGGLVMLALLYLRRVLAPSAFIALSSLPLVAFCLHLALSPDGWLFRRGGGWRPGPRDWVSLAAQLLAGGVVLLSSKLLLYEVQAHYPEKFWLALTAAGVLIFGAAAAADRRKRRRR